jgi:hypothetical protein
MLSWLAVQALILSRQYPCVVFFSAGTVVGAELVGAGLITSLSYLPASRARAHACIRKWDLSRSDYTTVLLHQPGNEAALAGLREIQDTVIVLPMMGDDLIENVSN